MYIKSFWARGYRSLVDVQLDDLGPYAVFYGRNGSGKSNVLAAIDTFFRLVGARMQEVPGNPAANLFPTQAPNLIGPDDFSRLTPHSPIVLGAVLASGSDAPIFRFKDHAFAWLRVEVTVDSFPEGGQVRFFSHLSTDREPDLLSTWRELEADLRLNLIAFLIADVGRKAHRLVPAARNLRAENSRLEGAGGAPAPVELQALLDQGRLKQALNVAVVHRDLAVRKRLNRLIALLAGEPLRRPPFAPFHDPTTGEYGIQEQLSLPDGTLEATIPLDLAGLGVQQVYAVLAHALLGATFTVGIEEPEAHLHAPTTGKDLRLLLTRLVDEGDLKQLFIATHSNLFDLDPTGWFEVSRDAAGATQVQRRTDLLAIDQAHLYEPGPAKHGLLDLLRVVPGDTVVLRRPDGRGVSAEEMIDLLQKDDREAEAYLRDVYGAAVRMIQIDAELDSDDEDGPPEAPAEPPQAARR